MTDQEKVASWKGEKVVLLLRPSGCTGAYMPVRGDECYLEGKKEVPLPEDKYHGKTGIVVESALRKGEEPEVPISLDGSGERIVARSERCLGSFSFKTKAKFGIRHRYHDNLTQMC